MTTREKRPAADRFWEKVNKQSGVFCAQTGTECWLWTASLLPGGYGQLSLGVGLTGKAHALSYEWAHGTRKNLCVCHTCDHPACVNPDHLFLGTSAENSADMKRKGRAARETIRRKLTPLLVRRIRASTASRETLATRFGISVRQVSRVRSHVCWGDV